MTDHHFVSNMQLWTTITGRAEAGKALATLPLHRLPEVTEGELRQLVSARQARRVLAVQEVLRRAFAPIPRGKSIREPADVYRLLQGLHHAPVEEFHVVLLDSRHRMLEQHCVARGGRNMVSVLPRDVFALAVKEPRCCSVILVHNHPSGDPTPSEDDIYLTERFTTAGELLGVPVRDHVILGDGAFASLAELGHI